MGTSEPRSRSMGGAPGVRWRSDAFCLTTSTRISEKSKFIPREHRHRGREPEGERTLRRGADPRCEALRPLDRTLSVTVREAGALRVRVTLRVPATDGWQLTASRTKLYATRARPGSP